MYQVGIHLFGACQVIQDGQPLQDTLPEKVCGLLAYLALGNGRPVRREKLAGLFWPEASEQHARHSLSQALYVLESVLPSGLFPRLFIASHNEIRFNREHCQLDVDMFDVLLHAVSQHQHAAAWACPDCLDHLQNAVGLYQTGLLTGLNLDDCREFSAWILPKREEYLEKFLQACAVLVKGYQAQGDFHQALAYARRQVEINPLYEPGHRQVMDLLCQLGRFSEAISQYEACKQIMETELDIEPDHETFSLYTLIISRHLGVIEAQPVRQHNLPAPRSGLVGRQADIERLCQMLLDPACCQVTILGGGGFGKTALALATGQALLPYFDDGVYLVDFTAFQPGESFSMNLARAVGIAFDTAQMIIPDRSIDPLWTRLVDYLRPRQMLLIFDSFENALASTDLLVSLLGAAGRSKILVTSQVRIDLQMEWVYPLAGLDYPSEIDRVQPIDQYPAVQLFLQAAHRVHPSFQLDPASSQAVGDICRLVQGVPLGILLAAAWVDILPVQQILTEIQRSLDFLSNRWGDVPERQHSMRAIFDASFARLNLAEQEALMHLAVFNSPFSTERAIQVAGVLPQLLKRLTGFALLQVGDAQRLEMHSLLRRYALEKLARSLPDDHSVHSRHSQVMLAALAQYDTALKSRVQHTTQALIDAEYSDILAAWHWACAHGEVGWLEKAIDPLEYYHALRGMHWEAVDLVQASISLLESAGIDLRQYRLGMNLQFWLCMVLFRLLRYSEAQQVLQAMEAYLKSPILSEIGIDLELARLSFARGLLLMTVGENRAEAIPHMQRCLKHIENTGDRWQMSRYQVGVANWYDLLGYLDEALHLTQSAMVIQREFGDPFQIASILSVASVVSLRLGDHETGMRMTQEFIALRESLYDPLRHAQARGYLAIAHFYGGGYEQARSLALIALRLFDQPHDLPYRSFYRLLLDCIDLMTGNYIDVLKNQSFAGEPMDHDDDARTSWCRGSAHIVFQQWDQAEIELHRYLAYCLAITRLDMAGMPMALLGYIAHCRGLPQDARSYLIRALENGLAQGFYWVLSLSLATQAVILADKGDLDSARKMYTSVLAHPSVRNSMYFRDVFAKHIPGLEGDCQGEVLPSASGLRVAAQEVLASLRQEIC